jgi:hypothetical protein
VDEDQKAEGKNESIGLYVCINVFFPTIFKKMGDWYGTTYKQSLLQLRDMAIYLLR